MFAIDTNLIVRYLVGEDPGQAARARRLIGNNDVFVCTTVLLETEWVPRSVYGFSIASVSGPARNRRISLSIIGPVLRGCGQACGPCPSYSQPKGVATWTKGASLRLAGRLFLPRTG